MGVVVFQKNDEEEKHGVALLGETRYRRVRLGHWLQSTAPNGPAALLFFYGCACWISGYAACVEFGRRNKKMSLVENCAVLEDWFLVENTPGHPKLQETHRQEIGKYQKRLKRGSHHSDANLEIPCPTDVRNARPKTNRRASESKHYRGET